MLENLKQKFFELSDAGQLLVLIFLVSSLIAGITLFIVNFPTATFFIIQGCVIVGLSKLLHLGIKANRERK